MAVIHRDHLSSEAGHSSGASRVVLTLGLVLVGLGVGAFIVGLGMGMVDASRGGAGDSSVQLFGIGGSAVVAGMLLAAVGMAWARRNADE